MFEEIKRLESEDQYAMVFKRVEELMLGLPEDTPEDDPLMIELKILGRISFTWKPICSQFFIVEAIPDNAVRFKFGTHFYTKFPHLDRGGVNFFC